MDDITESRHANEQPSKEFSVQEQSPQMPPPPAPVARWVRYLLAFGISVAVGLAPLLGRLRVPLFSPLLDLIPDDLGHTLIPVTSALMGLAAVLVQWYSGEDLDRATRRKALMRSIGIAFVGVVTFYALTIFVVKHVDYGAAGNRKEGTFVVGFVRPYRQPCEAGVSDEMCIEYQSFNQAKIKAFWGDTNINLAELALSAAYLTFMLGFASAVGVVMHRRGDV
jgi:hypothetical protein